jgi:antitoxin component YwqK of YwqJK toxin-antitoxin module
MYSDYSNSQTEIFELTKKYLYTCSKQKLLIQEYNVWKQKYTTRIKEYSKEEKRYVEDLKKILKEFKELAYKAEKAVQESIGLCANLGISKIIKSESELQNMVNIHNNYNSAADKYDAIKSQKAYMHKYLLEFKNSNEFKKENCEKYLVLQIENEDNVNQEIIYLQKYVDSINISFKKLPIEQQQIKLDKAKENYFQKYKGFVTEDTNLEYGKTLSTESIRNEIANVRKALNCYNEVTSKKTYHTNKKLKMVGSFWGNKRTGKWISYYPNGKTQSIGYYLNDKLEGPYYQYDEDGLISATGDFKNDERVGYWKFIENNIKSEGFYKNGEEDGVWKEYYKDETLKSSTTYVNGNKVGWAEEYLPNGSITKKGNYNKGKGLFGGDSYEPKGIWNYWTYYSNGQLNTKKTIDEDTGFEIGDYESYYENGDLQEKGKYVNNKRDGEWYFYIDFKKNQYLSLQHTKQGKYKVIFKNGEAIKLKDVNSQFDSIED